MLWQHIVLCKSTLLGMRLAMSCVVCLRGERLAVGYVGGYLL